MNTKAVMPITDEQIAELEMQCEKFAGFAVYSILVEQLISRLRAAEIDAARYRWLTDGKRGDYCWNNVLSEEDRGDHDYLDIAIDTSMKGEQQ